MDAYNGHAGCCIVKPVDFDSLPGIIGMIEDLWLRVVKLPENRVSWGGRDETAHHRG